MQPKVNNLQNGHWIAKCKAKLHRVEIENLVSMAKMKYGKNKEFSYTYHNFTFHGISKESCSADSDSGRFHVDKKSSKLRGFSTSSYYEFD